MIKINVPGVVSAVSIFLKDRYRIIILSVYQVLTKGNMEIREIVCLFKCSLSSSSSLFEYFFLLFFFPGHACGICKFLGQGLNTGHNNARSSPCCITRELLFFVCFLGLHPQQMEVPRMGSNWSCSCWPTPQQC